MKNKIILILATFVGVILLFYVNTLYHESAHEAIMINHECINVTKEVNLLGGVTRCEEFEPNRTDLTINQEELLHSINDIVGYSIITIMSTMFSCTALLILKRDEY